MKTRNKVMISVAAAVGAGALTFAGVSFGGGKALPHIAPPTAERIQALRQDVLSLAAENGDPSPTDGAVVASTRSAAIDLIAPGTVVDSDPPVYLAIANGKFTAEGSAPPNAEAPTGSVLVAVYDAKTGALLDWGLLQTAPDLAELGEVQPLF